MNDQPRVIVTDVQMNFWSMVTFMVKWALASIPAFFLLFLIGLAGALFFRGLVG